MGFMEIINQITNIIYPIKCVFCGDIIPINKTENVCVICSQKLRFLTQNICEKCGKPHEQCGELICFDCRKNKHMYTAGRALWLYDALIKQGISNYKFHNQKSYYQFFGEQMFLYYIKHIEWQIDLITSVPLHPDKQATRTYNQAALLADYLASKLDVAVDNHLLKRIKKTKPQKELTDQDRKDNIKNAFGINGDGKISYNNILIIDDIYTTGSTIDACSKVLLDNGANSIFFMTLAIGRGF